MIVLQEMKASFPKVEEFATHLEELGSEYFCSSVMPQNNVFVSFLGTFEQQVVRWDMTLATLTYWNESSETLDFRCPFIEIAGCEDGVCQIRVGLNVTVIDDPVIKKTIIMVRNYKRLKFGKHEFCSD